MLEANPDISIIIVNYKVKEYVLNLLASISRAKNNLLIQTIIIDNNSEDDSIEYLSSNFPEVTYIENDKNVGFGKANNQGIRLAKSTFTLIINPDTIVSEDTFTSLIDYMKNNPNCGAAGCKILNPDGTFAPESKRSVPTIWTSITKVLGLSSLFPKSKIFDEYYLGWLDEDETVSVPVLSGSFMFWRTSVLKELEGFDERFFMYGEDIDLCYRIQKTQYHIDYVPITSIIHYKGESTKKGDLKYNRIFNEATYLFFNKHYSAKYSYFFKGVIFISIWLKTLLSNINKSLGKLKFIAFDLLILNSSIILGFLVRFSFSNKILTNIQNLEFLWINLLASALYIFAGATLDIFRAKKDSISIPLQATVVSYAGIALVTFFARGLAYSRIALIIGLVCAVFLVVVFKLIQINKSNEVSKITGKLNFSKVILVGDGKAADEIKSKIHSRPDWDYEVVGVISLEEKPTKKTLGSLSQLENLINVYKIDQVFFLLKSISYKEMLSHISLLQNTNVVCKLIPEKMDFILGKSNVEYLDSIPLVEVNFAYSKGSNRFLKRVFDVALIFPFTLIFTLLFSPAILFSKKKKSALNQIYFFDNPQKNKWKNRTLLSWSIFSGDMSLVGSPISFQRDTQHKFKTGLTGLVQINKNRINSHDDIDNYSLFYVQNYSIWMDIDILVKSILKGVALSEQLEEAFKIEL